MIRAWPILKSFTVSTFALSICSRRNLQICISWKDCILILVGLWRFQVWIVRWVLKINFFMDWFSHPSKKIKTFVILDFKVIWPRRPQNGPSDFFQMDNFYGSIGCCWNIHMVCFCMWNVTQTMRTNCTTQLKLWHLPLLSTWKRKKFFSCPNFLLSFSTSIEYLVALAL